MQTEQEAFEQAQLITRMWHILPRINLCFYCGSKTHNARPQFSKRPTVPGPFTRTRDHVFPKSAGGCKTVMSCRRCNGIKANKTLERFREYLSTIDKPYEFYFEKRFNEYKMDLINIDAKFY